MNGQQLHNFVNDRMPGGGYPWELLGPGAQKAWEYAAAELVTPQRASHEAMLASGYWTPDAIARAIDGAHVVSTAAPLTDDQIEVIFNSMPGGPRGFCIEWGYIQFAKAIMERHATELANRAARAEQELEAMRRRWRMAADLNNEARNAWAMLEQCLEHPAFKELKP